jgi:hypothetical protein
MCKVTEIPRSVYHFSVQKVTELRMLINKDDLILTLTEDIMKVVLKHVTDEQKVR